MSCECNVCTVLERMEAENVPEWVVELWINADAEANYYRSILDGSWPSAGVHLRHALSKLEEKK